MQSLWKTVWRFLKKLKIELSYDLAISLLGIYLDELKHQFEKRHVPLFIIAKVRKQPRCPLIDECMKGDAVFTYNGLLVIKDGILTIYDNMDGPGGYCAM